MRCSFTRWYWVAEFGAFRLGAKIENRSLRKAQISVVKVCCCRTCFVFGFPGFSCLNICRIFQFICVCSPRCFIADITQAHKNHQLCSLIGVEGGHSLGGSLGVLRTFYSLGVRYMTLTSTCHTPWADSSNADAPKYDVKHGGLTPYGKVSQ